jgi:hypothetical protein
MFRKKVFAVMATVLFVGSTMSMAPAVEETMECEILANELHEALQKLGVSHKDAFILSGEVLDACEAAQLD